jgi:hypothetical protein
LIEINNQKGSLNAITKTDIVSYSKVETPLVSKEYLNAYAGKYFSTETNSAIIISQKDGKLMLKLKPNNEFQLNPTYKDAFTISDYGGNLYFIKNKKKKTIGMKIGQARARNIEFTKLE